MRWVPWVNLLEVRLGRVNAGHVRAGQYNSLAMLGVSYLTQCSSQTAEQTARSGARERETRLIPRHLHGSDRGINQCKANWKFGNLSYPKITTERPVAFRSVPRLAPRRHNSPGSYRSHSRPLSLGLFLSLYLALSLACIPALSSSAYIKFLRSSHTNKYGIHNGSASCIGSIYVSVCVHVSSASFGIFIPFNLKKPFGKRVY